MGEYSLAAESLFVTQQDRELFIPSTSHAQKTRIQVPLQRRRHPESEDRFFLEGTDADFTFTRGAAGAGSGVVARFGDGESPGRRVR